MVPPQPSPIEPHCAPSAEQLFGTHTHWLFAHVSLALQLPHASVPPQPSEIEPHSAPSSEQLFGWQPHWLATPPPAQTSGALQPPQSTVSPQPSETSPHSAPTSEQESGVHVPVPQRLGPAAPQV
jgi:hypothetical protein